MMRSPMNGNSMRRIAIVVMASVTGACLGDRASAPTLMPPEQMLGAIIVSPPAALIATGGTVQLGLTATSLTGTPITEFDSVWYALDNLADTARVQVTSGGLVQGRVASSTLIRMTVYAFRHGTAKGDFVRLLVTPAPIPGATLSVQSVPPDSTRLAVGSGRTLPAVIRNPATGETMQSPAIRIMVKPQDSLKVTLGRPQFKLPGADGLIIQNVNQGSEVGPTARTEGTVWIHALIDAYGTVLRDSVLYTLTPPYTASLGFVAHGLTVGVTNGGSTFNAVIGNGNTLTLSRTATVSFVWAGNRIPSKDVTIAFDDPTKVTAATPPATVGGSTGDVRFLNATTSVTSTRRFNTVGTYRWTMTTLGGAAPWHGITVSGVIVIK